ncbi:MAG: glycosyltransferase family 2 protein, partial [Clostridium sp.]|nr:glycosyltransferase family 2 protein [Clostridium sp.]
NDRYFKRKALYCGDEIKNELVTAYFHGHPFPVTLWGKIYRTELLRTCGKYLKNTKFLGEDFCYNIEIFLKINKVGMVDMPLYYYRHAGGTSKYMPYFFHDIIEGYKIQKEVIEEYFTNTKESTLGGPSIMLLNTFKTCLQNINFSDMSNVEIENCIKEFTKNKILLEVIKNSDAKEYFDNEYLEAINNSDYKYLNKLGKDAFNRGKLRRKLIKIIG